MRNHPFSFKYNAFVYKRPSLSPSLWVQSMLCTRRFWLKASGIVADTLEEFTYSNQPALPVYPNWRYEVSLPDGARIDAWIPEHNVAIEYKSVAPHISHVYQVWSLWQSAFTCGLVTTEFQLWYPVQFTKEAQRLADAFAFDIAPFEHFICICIDAPTHAQEDELLEFRAQAEHIIEAHPTLPPETKRKETGACNECYLFEFCHS